MKNPPFSSPQNPFFESLNQVAGADFSAIQLRKYQELHPSFKLAAKASTFMERFDLYWSVNFMVSFVLSHEITSNVLCKENYMPEFCAAGKLFDADLLVFDKDGLMFDAEYFWRELANTRASVMHIYCNSEDTSAWARLMGADTRFVDGNPQTSRVDPLGILAVASPMQEIAVTGGFLVSRRKWNWDYAHNIASEIFRVADNSLDLSRALKPQPGFENLMQRLIKLDVPYGVATSDTYDRTRQSMSLYNCWENVNYVVTPGDVANGKPAPDMLLLISKRSNIAPSRITMIGDSYVDMKMAHTAGCVGIGVSADKSMRELMAPYASAVLESLNEFFL